MYSIYTMYTMRYIGVRYAPRGASQKLGKRSNEHLWLAVVAFATAVTFAATPTFAVVATSAFALATTK